MPSENEIGKNSTPSILSCPLIRQGIGTTSFVILHGSKESLTKCKKTDFVFCQECVAWKPDGKRGEAHCGWCHCGPPCDDHKWPLTCHNDFCFSGIKEYDVAGERLIDGNSDKST